MKQKHHSMSQDFPIDPRDGGYDFPTDGEEPAST